MLYYSILGIMRATHGLKPFDVLSISLLFICYSSAGSGVLPSATHFK